MDELKLVGPRLRALRTARGWTLDELSSKIGISPSTLSRLEAGKRQATLELLLPITRALGTSIEELVRTTPPDPRVRRSVIRRDGLLIVPLSPEHSPIKTYKITYPASTQVPALRTHDGYEWLYVISGRLRLRLGDQDLTLEPGEAAEFDTSIPHAMTASATKPAQVISIFNDNGARLHTHVANDSVDDMREKDGPAI